MAHIHVIITEGEAVLLENERDVEEYELFGVLCEIQGDAKDTYPDAQVRIKVTHVDGSEEEL